MENRGYCGLNCETCDAFVATKNNDNNLREKTAKEWSKMNQVEIRAEDINCVGCKEDGVKISFCAYCEIRSSNITKGYSSCAECKEYPCEQESNLINNVPDAREYIEKNRK